MENYNLTIEDGMITYIEDLDKPGILYLPADVVGFSADAWVSLGSNAEGICVHPDNPVFFSVHNCLLSKDGATLIKACKSSDISKLTGLEVIGSDAFQTPWTELEQFVFRIPDGVQVLDYRAFALSATKAEITVPASVRFVDLMAFMIHSDHTHIIFEGDGDMELRPGVFGTEAEARDSDFEIYRTLPAVLYPRPEHITVSCRPGSSVSFYCKKYGIPEV